MTTLNSRQLPIRFTDSARRIIRTHLQVTLSLPPQEGGELMLDEWIYLDVHYVNDEATDIDATKTFRALCVHYADLDIYAWSSFEEDMEEINDRRIMVCKGFNARVTLPSIRRRRLLLLIDEA